MGNHKFRFSNIIPNAWFYKLKQMSSSSNNKSIRNNHTTTKPTNLDQAPDEAAAVSIPTTPLQVMTISQSHPRKSYHFTRNLNAKSPPRKSSRKTTSSVSAACSCATATVHSVKSKPPSTTTSSSLDNLSLPPELQCFDRMLAWSSTSCNCSSNSLVADDDVAAVIGVDDMSLAPNTQETVISSVDLPPIKAQHKKFSDLVREIGAADQEEEEEIVNDKPRKQRKSPVRRISTSSGSPRVRIRINSPRLSKRVESNGGRRKSVSRGHERVKSSESMAVVKSSADPERDFRESMVEMIVENEIRAAKDLEELLACYLSLNSAEYHHLIIQVFQQIWFDLNRIH